MISWVYCIPKVLGFCRDAKYLNPTGSLWILEKDSHIH